MPRCIQIIFRNCAKTHVYIYNCNTKFDHKIPKTGKIAFIISLKKKMAGEFQNNSRSKNTKKKSKPNREERELMETVDELLKFTTLSVDNSVGQLLECQKRIVVYIDKIKSIEEKLYKRENKTSSINNNGEKRESKQIIDNFTNWLTEHGAELKGCSICSFDTYDLGIRVEQDLPQFSLVITVPRKIMMTVEIARKSIVQDLLNKVELLKNMPNILLAIFLLVEKFSDNSFWKPYIDILPKSYNNTHYFTTLELEELKGSPTLEVALKQMKSLSRQYAYFHKLFWTSHDRVSELLRKKFTYEEYCWAVSTVMTRQNMIPSEDGTTKVNAFIPLWDLCNHSNGILSTEFNPELQRSECLAFKEFKAGEQFFIFYGLRTNADFFIHNGFVYEENEHDSYPIRLGISKSDPLQQKRQELLNKLGMSSLMDFPITKGAYPIDGRLLAFLRVFNMNADQLDHWIQSDKISDLYNMEHVFDLALEEKSWTFLKARLNLLLASYKTKLEEDETFLKKDNLPPKIRLAIQMRLCEKRLLRNCLEYAETLLKISE